MAKHKYIETPERLLELFEEYVKHEQENPLYKRDYVGKDGLAVDTPLVTPITFEGFEVYLFQQKIISDLGHYSSNKDDRYTDYVTIITYIRKFCYSNNFKGASVNLFNANLIAKKLGISEKIETKQVDKFDFDI
jgi:hypothetical protein